MALTRRPGAPLVLAVLLSLTASSFLVAPATSDARPESNPTGQVTVFWGRNKNEGSLREACDSGMYTMAMISFLNVVEDPVRGGGRSYHLDLSGHQLAGIGDDIKHCQAAGVLVSLSVASNHSSVHTNQSAADDLADHLWHAYLGGGSSGSSGVARPFGDASLDGVDLFLLDGGRGIPPEHNYGAVLGKALAKRGGGKVHLTATSGCGFQPAGLTEGVFERIHVRFYRDHADSSGGCGEYSEGVWDKWAAAYPSSRIYLGLPASPEAAGEGYLYPKSLYYGVLPVVQASANYGGVMLWDRFYDRGSNYSNFVKRWA